MSFSASPTSLNPPPVTPAMPARERILQTAHRLFYSEGIRATGIDLIIREAQVTKATFYRHFPSKNDLVAAYLDFRHERWMAWFRDALVRHGTSVDYPLQALTRAMAEWFAQPGFRGCAFINGVVEADALGDWVADISRRHKQEMADAIEQCLAPSAEAAHQASAAALMVDGAILRAQMEKTPEGAVNLLDALLRALTAKTEKTA